MLNWSFASYVSIPHAPHPASNIFVFTVPGSHENIDKSLVLSDSLSNNSYENALTHALLNEYEPCEENRGCCDMFSKSILGDAEIDATFNILDLTPLARAFDVNVGSNAPVNAYGANTFTANVISNPSHVSSLDFMNTPALLKSISIDAPCAVLSTSSANAATPASELKSCVAPNT